jgi:hypothetical protein
VGQRCCLSAAFYEAHFGAQALAPHDQFIRDSADGAHSGQGRHWLRQSSMSIDQAGFDENHFFNNHSHDFGIGCILHSNSSSFDSVTEVTDNKATNSSAVRRDPARNTVPPPPIPRRAIAGVPNDRRPWAPITTDRAIANRLRKVPEHRADPSQPESLFDLVLHVISCLLANSQCMNYNIANIVSLNILSIYDR